MTGFCIPLDMINVGCMWKYARISNVSGNFQKRQTVLHSSGMTNWWLQLVWCTGTAVCSQNICYKTPRGRPRF